MTSPTDPLWMHLASIAKVRPCHVYHQHAAMREAKSKFVPAAFAMYAQLDLKHVLAIMEAFETEGVTFTTTRRETDARASRLPAAFVMPDEWLLWAQTERGWSREVCETEAVCFKDWFIGKGTRHVEWLAVWRGWVRRSKVPNGQRAPAPKTVTAIPTDPAEYVAYCKAQIASASQIRNFTQIRIWRERLEKAEAALNASC